MSETNYANATRRHHHHHLHHHHLHLHLHHHQLEFVTSEQLTKFEYQ